MARTVQQCAPQQAPRQVPGQPRKAPRPAPRDEDEDEYSCKDYDSNEEGSDVEMGPPDEDEHNEINGGLTDEERRLREELENSPMRAELKHLEKRWTKKGRGYICEPKEDEEIPEQRFNWYEKFALCVTRQYDDDNKYVVRTALQVNSPALKEVLRDVIGSFPGDSFYTNDVSVTFPARCLYHYRAELAGLLARLQKEEPGSDKAAHLPILLDFISEHFADTIKEGDNLREKGLVTYEHLWTLFRPGSLVYAHRLSQARVFKLESYDYVCGDHPGLRLSVSFVDFDGASFGTRTTCVTIPQFGGVAPIAELSALPLDMHPDKGDLERLLTARGRRWEAHAGQNFREYKGVALDGLGLRYNIDGRVMVDTATHHRLEANTAFRVNPFPRRAGDNNSRGGKKALRADDKDLLPQDYGVGAWEPLTDEQCLLASPTVRGFSFTEKRFLEFFIDRLSDIEWNTACFEQLVLPDSQKELVQALVAEHTQRTTDPNSKGFDDIVKGKGRGLILVLHGPPGVGKTLTAECVAEFSRRPLYIVSSGDLGTTSGELDHKLGRALDLASTWKAVLLIDEADVFLERRSLHDMARNGLVSIFLRTLEYYSGILFMTTNRVRTFDDAFKSRIHVPLKYEELPAPSRKRIWRNFLGGVEGGVDIDDDGYDRLAEGRLNGRQIKNVVRTAKSLAAHKKRRLDHAQLQQVMDIQMAFEQELDAVGDEIDQVER
ncbi:uncharacterized protein E0L32_006138 [Thyridium curvatum]|uniref:AAA+ ATPase domain-containing protein n=1 Tax=Thyridium curvatum TaxID=1093900 RepID=A0A507B9G0_9PEZI|nr:uncharacterized protein E0L32_006138 [Thyridium curvatum]TPX13408.1 hypothetical protein E0L32_006138 [Thyridium curvatum]